MGGVRQGGVAAYGKAGWMLRCCPRSIDALEVRMLLSLWSTDSKLRATKSSHTRLGSYSVRDPPDDRTNDRYEHLYTSGSHRQQLCGK